MTRRPWLALGGLFAVLVILTVVWVSIDRRPPDSDHANHLERALRCHLLLTDGGPGTWRAILEQSSFYPPLVPCAAGVLYFAAPVVPLTAQAVMLAALGLGLVTTFLIGRRLLGVEAGLLAAFFFGTAPFVVYSLNNFQLDLPLAAMVAFALWVLLRTEGFARRGWCVAFGVVFGLGMMTKPTFGAYVLPAMLWPLSEAWRAPDRRRRLLSLAVLVAIAAVLALPWYGPRLTGLPMQIANRSFKQAAEAGQVEAYTPAGLSYYPRVFLPQFGLLAGLVCVWGLWAVRRWPRARAFLWLATLPPLVMFSLIQNKNLRYTLPILPAAALVTAAGILALRTIWKRAAVWACVAVAVVSVSMSEFALPPPPQQEIFPVQLVVSFPPSSANWQQDRVLDDVMRASGGQPARVSVVPNYNFFSVSNFRYEALRRDLPLQMSRAVWDPPLGIDFFILKTGSQGPSFTTAKADRATAAFARDRYLAAAFPVIGEYPLPDASTGILRVRRIAPVDNITPAEMARRLREIPPDLFADHARDVEDLRVSLDYRDDAILRGEIDSIRVEWSAATIGEHVRRDRAPLRVRDGRLEADRLVINPQRFVDTGRIEILDAGEFRIERAVVTQEAVDALLRGQPVGRGMRITLEDGRADVRHAILDSRASLMLGPGTGEAPFSIEVSGLRVAGIPVPGLLVNWIVRNFDPTLRLRDLPVPVVVAPVAIRPGRLEIGSP